MRNAARHIATNAVEERRSSPLCAVPGGCRGGVRRYWKTRVLFGLLGLISAASFGQSLSVTTGGAIAELHSYGEVDYRATNGE